MFFSNSPRIASTPDLETLDVAHFDAKGLVIENWIAHLAHAIEMRIARGVLLPVEFYFKVFRRHARQIALFVVVG